MERGRIHFLFGVHNHQPVGNFDHVFRDAFAKAYHPFLTILHRHPRIRCAIHLSGPLLEWIDAHERKYLDLLGEMMERGQVEMMGGGFYEPILTVVPERDAVGQIEMMSDFLERRFGRRPRGLWLAERVWEPQVPSILAKAGIEYTVVDESHFSYSGLTADEMFGYYMSEDKGALTRIFPIDRTLRYTVPFKLPEETIAYLRSIATADGSLAVTLADDGEKFGVWPGTHKWVYEEGYLERLFGVLEENLDWISMPTFSEFIDRFPPMGRVYLPTASYEEMMGWALPARSERGYEAFVEQLKSIDAYGRYKPYVRGGFWRNFMAKYPEANLMHKKMLLVSRKVWAHHAQREALEELWRGQCNCAYWHGLFGGLYLGFLRHAVYEHLIGAENILDGKSSRRNDVRVQTEDYDRDGQEEILASSREMNCYITPAYGGAVMELDYRPRRFNLTNVLARREEAYHGKIKDATLAEQTDGRPKSAHDIVAAKEPGLERHLVYDRHNRYSFLDHFLAEETTLESFSRCEHRELGDFVGEPYRFEGKGKTNAPRRAVVTLVREGQIERDGGPVPLRLTKTYTIFPRGRLEVLYAIENLGDETVDVWFGTEVNLTLHEGTSAQRYYECPGRALDDARLASVGEIGETEVISIVDRPNAMYVSMAADRPCTLWRFPVETISQSESGFERNYQGSCLLFHWKLHVPTSGTEKVRVDLWISAEEVASS